ncbi:hypothetical protein CBS101457_006206 [Exobasidium rhododendri]|nr:hypothetical protein CBS101457_006206 [Exobasidium rhododendri]
MTTPISERGLVLTAPITPSETILLLPAESLLNVRTLKGTLPDAFLPSKENPSHPDHWTDSDDEGSVDEARLPLTSVQALTLTLARWKTTKRREGAERGGTAAEDRIEELLCSFPPDYPTFPIMWQIIVQAESSSSDETMQACRALLEALPAHVAHLCDRVYKRFVKDVRAIRVSVEREGKTLQLPEKHLPLTDLGWAWCSVNSRCVFVPLGLKPHQDNFTLAPLLDMANHTMKKDLECKVTWTSTGGLQLRAPAKSHRPQGFLPGQEVMITYGAHSNGTLLSEYGFTLPSTTSSRPTSWDGNPFAEVNVDAMVEAELLEEKDEQARYKKSRLLQEHGYWKDYTIHPFPSPAHPSHRLLIALRLIAIPLLGLPSSQPSSSTAKRQRVQNEENNVKKWEDMLMGHTDIIDKENEAAVIAILLRICDKILVASTLQSEILRHSSLSDLDFVHNAARTTCIDVRQSKLFIETLLREEHLIAQMLKDGIRNGSVEW